MWGRLMEEQIVEENLSVKKEKKQRRESLLLKYGVIAFLEILGFISVFLIFMSHNIKAPLQSIYDESIHILLD